MAASPGNLDDAVTNFYKQADLFQTLGRQMERYMASIEDVQTAMANVHSTIISYSETISGPVPKFTALLEDQNELWTLLEQDIVKLGDDFQKFAQEFYIILREKEVLRGKKVEIETLRNALQKPERPPSRAETRKVLDDLREREREFEVLANSMKENLKKFEERQQLFIISHYKKLMAAHSDFYKDNMEILSLLPDAMKLLEK